MNNFSWSNQDFFVSVPVSVLSNDISNSAEEEEEDDDIPVIDDDFTTRGLERLSSAATCLVAGVEYTHGQQIYRPDPCEFCLCLDGEMFCWWQDCPPTMEGPCRDRGPFSPCLSVPANPLISSTSSSETFSSSSKGGYTAAASSTSTSTTQSSHETSSSNTSSLARVAISKNDTAADFEDTSTVTEEPDISSSETSQEASTSGEVPKKCVVMGREYQIGDKLPHNTGNCVECVCGLGAKVTCSPHQCAPAGDEINDYHLPGARQLLPADIF
ncbi:unnamed protein product [Acanthoscelides obtectus]|uniref:VWFC domain-containing protein n=1 Tax=Acanthoscelides obtectus TaxID=200917 RepID=A0A9P0K4S6_ACAOB|nr:unnamed protein product [Acanthoscelides obtectus]CAK1676801.1 hypothetical protein AOBTE_LOCUS30948 [Acanthoscelides obtectus]